MNIPTNKKTTNDMLHNLYIKPTKDKGLNAPTYPDFKDNVFHQMDILFLPDDDGYKYALVIVDVGSRLVDARPLKTKSASDVLKALKQIYSGKYLKPPSKVIGVDSGSEFRGPVKNYFDDIGVFMKIGKPDRHRQQAIVERKNKDIGKKLFYKMTAEELQTGEVSTAWVENLPSVIKEINKKRKKKLKKRILTIDHCSGDACELIVQGTKVRAVLDAPRNVHDGKKLHGQFRETDIRWDPKPRTVMLTTVSLDQPPLYFLDDASGNVDRSVGYTKNQLQIIPENEKKPKESEIMGLKEKGVKKWKIDKLLKRKKVNNRIYFEVKWIGFKNPSDVLRSDLMKDAPELVKEFEKSLK